MRRLVLWLSTQCCSTHSSVGCLLHRPDTLWCSAQSNRALLLSKPCTPGAAPHTNRIVPGEYMLVRLLLRSLRSTCILASFEAVVCVYVPKYMSSCTVKIHANVAGLERYATLMVNIGRQDGSFQTIAAYDTGLTVIWWSGCVFIDLVILLLQCVIEGGTSLTCQRPNLGCCVVGAAEAACCAKLLATG